MSESGLSQIASRADFHAAVRAALAMAAEQSAREICVVDPTFEDWPLNERGIVESLGRWAQARRRFIVFGHDFDEMARRAPRFDTWRRQWSHIVQCRADPELEAAQVPTLLFVSGVIGVRLLDRVRYRGTVSARPVDHVECRETIDALLQRSVEAFPPTTLGL